MRKFLGRNLLLKKTTERYDESFSFGLILPSFILLVKNKMVNIRTDRLFKI